MNKTTQPQRGDGEASKMNEYQTRIMVALKAPGALSSIDIAARLKPRSCHIAVTSSLRSLERRGWVGRIPPSDRWDCARWFRTTEDE